MNDAPLPVLLLAWDDADPAPAQLGAPLPAGAALQAALAPHVALTVMLPQLPAPAAPEAALLPPAPATAPPAGTSSAAAAGEEESRVDAPGSETSSAPTTAAPNGTPLAGAAPSPTPPPGPKPGAAVLVGLADLTLAGLDAVAPWPGASTDADPATGTREPAAPYVGSGGAAGRRAPELAPNLAPAGPAPAPFAAELFAAELSKPAAPAALLAAPGLPAAPPRDPDSSPDPVLSAAGRAGAEEAAADPGPAEAADLTQWTDDLTLTPPAAGVSLAVESARPAALAALRRPTLPVSAEVLAAAAALSFRVIQYARFATQLAPGGGAAGGVVFAAAWPTWLAAVEIRQRTGRPLVLYVAALPSEQGPRPARGWLRELERQALMRADVVLVSSAALAEQLRARYRLRQPARVLAGPPAPSSSGQVSTDLQDFAIELLPLLRAAAGGPA